MSYDFRLPNISGNDHEMLQQIRSYLYQFIPQLQWSLNSIDTSGESAYIPPTPRDAVQSKNSIDAEVAFNALKPYIIRSADILKAYYDEIAKKLSGKYVAEYDFNKFIDTIRGIEIPEYADLNTLTVPNNYFGSEVYIYTNSPPMHPDERSSFSLEVISLGGGGQLLQRATACSELATVYERQYFGGTWYPWECINPPLYTDTEYRTKERYMGKAVYTKLIYLGELPNATRKQVAHGATLTQVIRCCGHTSDGIGLPFHYDNVTDWIELYADIEHITVLTGNDQSTRDAIAQIWYTK